MPSALVVDDSAFIRRILRDMLTQSGITQVDEASDGVEAVEKGRTGRYDLIFMDLMMPRMDGLEAIKGITPFNKTSKIIICTSVGQDKVTQDAMNLGAVEFVKKPFDLQTVKSVVDKYIKF